MEISFVNALLASQQQLWPLAFTSLKLAQISHLYWGFFCSSFISDCRGLPLLLKYEHTSFYKSEKYNSKLNKSLALPAIS